MNQEQMNFSEALERAMRGDCMKRSGWNGKGQFIFGAPRTPVLFFADGKNEPIEAKMEPFLVLRNAQGLFVPWVPSQGDLYATDWQYAI